MQVAIIDYNAGNIQSVAFALARLGIEAIQTSNPEVIQAADKVIFPGVGEAKSTMQHLQNTRLDQVIKGLTQPVLGICLGMQLLCAHSEEGDTPCLGIIPQRVKRFEIADVDKIPQMGWNTLQVEGQDWINKSFDNSYMYFVHSYYVENGAFTTATANYGILFSAALRKDNFYATQFHPEKSGLAGQSLLESFLDI